MQTSRFSAVSKLFAAVAIGVLCAIIAGIAWWLHARQYETTDDAFIDARTVPISSQVSGKD